MVEKLMEKITKEHQQMRERIGEEKYEELNNKAARETFEYFLMNQEKEGCLFINLANVKKFAKRIAERAADLCIAEEQKML